MVSHRPAKLLSHYLIEKIDKRKEGLVGKLTATNATTNEELFMFFFSASWLLLNNLAALSHCHYTKLYFHFIRNMCGGWKASYV
jgi:hypothetical protein